VAFSTPLTSAFTDFTDATVYKLESSNGAGNASIASGNLLYTPSAADSGKVVKIEVRAQTGTFVSQAPAQFHISVSDLPPSNSLISPATASYDKSYRNDDLAILVQLYGNEITEIHDGSRQLALGTDYNFTEAEIGNTQRIYLKSGYLHALNTGTHTLTFTFNKSRTLNGRKFPLSLSVKETPLSSDATLSSLTLSGGALVPAFNQTTQQYTANVANSVSSIVIAATPRHSGATVSGTGQISLNTGVNDLVVTVTAENKVTTNVYTIAVTRQASRGSSSGGGGGGGGGSAPVEQVPVPVPVPPTPPELNQKDVSITGYISGADRVGTAVAISQKGWADGATTVIIASGRNQNLIDALGTAPLAANLDAPVLLGTSDILDPQVIAEIKRLGAKNIILVGAVGSAWQTGLTEAITDINVEVLSGSDRFKTLALLNERVTEPKGVFVVGQNALADAVSVASWAAANGYVIELADSNGNWSASEHSDLPGYVIGGSTLVKDIPGFARLAGADRYATNSIIRQSLPFKTDVIYTANGNTLVDALTGAVIAAKSGAAIVLLPNGDTQGADWGYITESTQIYAFGGKN
jgi:putative cell wall-binding protein